MSADGKMLDVEDEMAIVGHLIEAAIMAASALTLEQSNAFDAVLVAAADRLRAAMNQLRDLRGSL